MKKRLRLKHHKRRKLGLFFYILVIAFFFSLLLIFLAGLKLEGVIVRYGTIESKRIAQNILNKIVKEEDFSQNNLYLIDKNSSDEIEHINYNTKEVNEVLRKVNERANEIITSFEKGEVKELILSDSLKGLNYQFLKNGIVCEIPFGSLTGNSLLINTTMSVPLRFSFVSSINSNLETKVTEYGVNSALVELYIKVEITLRATLPHTTEEIKATASVPLIVELVKGRVPIYYQDSLNKESLVESFLIK